MAMPLTLSECSAKSQLPAKLTFENGHTADFCELFVRLGLRREPTALLASSIGLRVSQFEWDI